MKISIITPSYNQADYIEETIQSVLNQGYHDLEYIIIDGGSNDGSKEIIKKYDQQLAYWVSEPDQGQTDAINKGFRKATGDIVAWLNSDDIYPEGTLHHVAKAFHEKPEANLIYGDVMNFSSEGKEHVFSNPLFDPITFISKVAIHQPSVFWKRQLFDEIGMLDESFYYLMDYDLWMRIFYSYPTHKINQTLSRFRIHSEAKTADNPKGLYMDYRKVVSRFFNSFKDKGFAQTLQSISIYENPDDVAYPINIEKWVEMAPTLLQHYIFQCALQEYTFGNIGKANQLFAKCWQLNPMKISLFMLKNTLGLKKMGVI